MTKIKFCGLSRFCDIEAVNELRPEYVGFVFAPKSRRYITPEKAADLKRMLLKDILAVGVFVDENPETIIRLIKSGIIDIAQLHGHEDEAYIQSLRRAVGHPVIKAFRIKAKEDLADVEECGADYVLLDSGAGTGEVFNWKLIKDIKRPYFLAGGLTPDNVEEAKAVLCPYAVDVSSGIETDGVKDRLKMAAFADVARKGRQI